ncbi:redoxin family protein [Anaerotalea alkaliphila]|uniref:Redoxin family protein n=1 Tax=Anaerotalea alkaliphila TaxID=2662126 RepID=A0A7X5KP81_9FIRM|nr:redoxin family protein [Anaerotalea alkaliphila]NDL68703.1 redoxin family protein [Anaerotalea alkaliphila]
MKAGARVLAATMVLLLWITACGRAPQDAAPAATVNEGRMAPTFVLADQEGKEHSLEAYRGQKVYIRFWASWCPICLSGLEELQTLAETADGFTVLTIVSPNANGEKDTADFQAWFSGLDTNRFPVLFDENGVAAREYGVRGYPTSVYVGSDGVLVLGVPGHQSNESVTERMRLIR